MRAGDCFRVKPNFSVLDENMAYGINHIMLQQAGKILTVADVVDILGYRGYQDKEHGEYWSEEWVDELEDVTVVKTDIAQIS